MCRISYFCASGNFCAKPLQGSTATFTFTGTSVTWKTLKTPISGKADVFLDGEKVRTFDGYASSDQFGVTGYAATGLANTRHTLKLVVTGTKNAASDDYYVDVDRFLVGSTSYEEDHPSVAYDTWRGLRSNLASGGAYRESSSQDYAAFSPYFVGSKVTLVTATGPSRGTVALEVRDGNTDELVDSSTVNLSSPTVSWGVERSVTGLDPSRVYYLAVYSLDGKPVVYDAVKAIPYEGGQQTTSAATGAASTESAVQTDPGQRAVGIRPAARK